MATSIFQIDRDQPATGFAVAQLRGAAGYRKYIGTRRLAARWTDAIFQRRKPMKLIVSLAAAGMLVSPIAFAQSPTPPAASIVAQGGMFTTVQPTDRLSSEVIGLDVYNNANQDIGTIKDIAYSGANVKAYIVAVGGILGVGDHYVAVSPSDLKVSYDETAKKWHANMDTTADQLKSAPAFTYSSKA
jgi:hypothetical protein